MPPIDERLYTHSDFFVFLSNTPLVACHHGDRHVHVYTTRHRFSESLGSRLGCPGQKALQAMNEFTLFVDFCLRSLYPRPVPLTYIVPAKNLWRRIYIHCHEESDRNKKNWPFNSQNFNEWGVYLVVRTSFHWQKNILMARIFSRIFTENKPVWGLRKKYNIPDVNWLREKTDKIHPKNNLQWKWQWFNPPMVSKSYKICLLAKWLSIFLNLLKHSIIFCFYTHTHTPFPLKGFERLKNWAMVYPYDKGTVCLFRELFHLSKPFTGPFCQRVF